MQSIECNEFVDMTKPVKRSGASDWRVLKSIWFHRASGTTHSERLESFYAPQASGYDNFRNRFLHARDPLLQECSKALNNKTGIVWVDLGGGTAENVHLMEKYLPLERFGAVYVVDLCHSLCEEAKLKVQHYGK